MSFIFLPFGVGSLLIGLVFFFKVVIEGFKSYREQIATEDFSPKVNCVGNYFIQKLLDDFVLIQHNPLKCMM